MDATQAFETLKERRRRLDTLKGARALLAWDQQTGMPGAGSVGRGAQLSLLGQLEHEWIIDPEIRRLLDVLRESDDPLHRRTALVFGRQVDRSVNVPPDLVARMSEAQAESFAAWVDAKNTSRFDTFAPHLQKILDLTLEELQAIDPDRHPYEVALEAFDPGTTVASLRKMFSRLREGLVELLDAIGEADGPAAQAFPATVEVQRALHHELATALGYDFGAGRLDESAHPFTIDIGPGDVRITTAYDPADMLAGLGGTVHEVGHALYEQGLPKDTLFGTGLDTAASMGLHESQSRFWENAIGRSREFSHWFAPMLREHLGAGAPDAESLFAITNRVERSLIRIFADEVTYNLHIIVRFELELALIEGRLAVEDLPDAWNAAYEETLHVTPPDDAQGCLQDVHWAHGAFGYFPSYTLGNLYAAGLTRTLEDQRPTLWREVEAGQFGPVLNWLRENVHRKGAMLDAPDLVSSICGERDLVADMLDHLWGRHGALYGVSRG